MTITRDQAQMLATLAIACRPNRAPTWDAPGVMAMIERVRTLDLGEVIAATIRLAKDPHAKTPADIAKPSSECWREQLKGPKWTPDQTPREHRCGICAKPRERCEGTRLAGDDHAFESDVRRDHGTDVPATVGALRELKNAAPLTRPTTPQPKETA